MQSRISAVFRWATQQQQQQQQQKSFRIFSQDNDFVACQSGAATVAAGFYSAARSMVPAASQLIISCQASLAASAAAGPCCRPESPLTFKLREIVE